MEPKITYLKGDATRPQASPDENIILAHICNDVGVWGRGFVLAISKRWKEPEWQYRAWAAREAEFDGLILGSVQFVEVCRGWYVANMIAQRGLKTTRSVNACRKSGARRSASAQLSICRALAAGWQVDGGKLLKRLFSGSWWILGLRFLFMICKRRVEEWTKTPSHLHYFAAHRLTRLKNVE
jgi:hypothetical protein